MAGINLSGAIGMTGKRESVYSDLPSIIQQTGDYIAKARQEDKEKKAKLALLNAESGIKRQDDLSKFVSTNSDLITFNKQFQDKANQEVNNFASINNDPNATQAQKEQAKYDALKNIAQAHTFLKDAEKAYAQHEEDKVNPIYDVKEQEKALAGVYAPKPQEPTQEDLMGVKPSGIPNENYQQPEPKEVEQMLVRKPFHQMTYDEMINAHPQGLTTSLAGKKKLVNVTPTEAVENAVPKETWDASLDSDMNTQTHKLNQGNYNLAKATYINSVVSGKNNKSKVIQAGLQAEALRLIDRDHQDFTPEQKIAFVNDFVEQQSAKQFDETAKLKIDAIAEDRNRDWQKSRGGSKKEEEQGAVIERNVPANQGRVDWIRDDLSKQTKILEEFTPKMLSDYREDYKTADRNSTKYETAAQELSKYNTALNAKKVRTQELNEELSKQKKVKDINLKDEGIKINIDGRDVIGVDATGYRKDSQGNVFVYVNVPDADNPKTFVKKVVPYTPDMANELSPKTINSLRKNKFIDENNNEIIAKKSVSSQSTSKPKKETIIEGKTIPAGGVPKYSKTTGKLIGYELNGEKYKF